MYGGESILTTPLVAESFTQGSIFGAASADGVNDRFGRALAAGDFDRDGACDLAVGQPGEDAGLVDRGGMTILMGSPAGGLYERFRFLSAGIVGIPPQAQDSSDMGHSLAVGDFDHDGHADLVIGIPYWDEVFVNVGRVTVLYGALFADGFESNSTFYWSEALIPEEVAENRCQPIFAGVETRRSHPIRGIEAMPADRRSRGVGRSSPGTQA
jgi:hypothetical protein